MAEDCLSESKINGTHLELPPMEKPLDNYIMIKIAQHNSIKMHTLLIIITGY